RVAGGRQPGADGRQRVRTDPSCRCDLRREEGLSMKPIWHKLVTGGVGEVVPAEILQGVVQAQHDAVDLLAGDHVLDWRGLPVHAGLRWPVAVAKIEIRDISYSLDEVDQRLLFSEGFEDPPQIRGAVRPITVGGNPIRG